MPKKDDGAPKLPLMSVIKNLSKPWCVVLGLLIGMGLLGGGSQAVDIARGLIGLPPAPAQAQTCPPCPDQGMTEKLRELTMKIEAMGNNLGQRLARLEGRMEARGIRVAEDGP